jgi:hypothetical protein
MGVPSRDAGLKAPPAESVAPPAPLARFNPSAEGVEVAPIDGTQAPMAKLLQRSVAAALGRYNVPASYSAEGGGRYRLDGVALPNPNPAPSSVVAIEWRILDRRLGREAGRFTLPVVGDRFAWDYGDPRVIAQIGEGASRQFIAMIDGTDPVAVRHGPGDGAGASLSDPPPIENSATPAGAARDAPAVPARAASSEARIAAAPSRPARGGPAVFLARVGGAPGDGDAALAQATRAAMAVGGFDMAPRREDARYVVVGSVSVAAAQGGRQPVRIVWEVSAPDGRPLGRAVQENAVAEGALDGAWGPMASLVAGAAVAGIADVIRRSEQASARPAPGDLSERRLKIPPAPDFAGLPPPVATDFAKAGPAAEPSPGRSP